MICYTRFFFFQAEDGIRDTSVTGVQTCALPIFPVARVRARNGLALERDHDKRALGLEARTRRTGSRAGPRLLRRPRTAVEIGRASCRERVLISVVGG